MLFPSPLIVCDLFFIVRFNFIILKVTAKLTVMVIAKETMDSTLNILSNISCRPED
ncbi:hypothetical protein NUBL21986_40470 [Klebsiella pneumoniae]|nr:hypothetical protein NUBL21986_40470 [Klebsiella pneumoniae]